MVHPKSLVASRIEKDVDRVGGVGVHRAHDEARCISTDRYKSEVERPSVFADLLEGRAIWEMPIQLIVPIILPI